MLEQGYIVESDYYGGDVSDVVSAIIKLINVIEEGNEYYGELLSELIWYDKEID